MSLFPVGGSRNSHRRRGSMHKRVKHIKRSYGGGDGSGVATNAMEWLPLNGVPRVEGMNHKVSEPMGVIGVPPPQRGGHRCSMRHTRSKRTRKAHAGRKSRKHKSRGKKYGLGLKGIFGRS